MKIRWYLRQVLPLKYSSTYHMTDHPAFEDGQYHSEWRMWMGRSYNHKMIRVK